jgi:hypothetical protein
MLDRFLRRALLPSLLCCLVFSGCGRISLNTFKKSKQPVIVPAADPAVAAATNFSVTLVEIDIERKGEIASGSIKLDAPLPQATSGTYSLSGSPSQSILPAGKLVATTLQSNRSGKLQITHSGTLSIIQLLDKDGDPLLKIIGSPHGNTIKDHWFYQGADSGLATVTPRS